VNQHGEEKYSYKSVTLRAVFVWMWQGGNMQIPLPFVSSNTTARVSQTPEERQQRVTEILNGFGIPPEDHEEYIAILKGHLEIALDGYFARLKHQAALKRQESLKQGSESLNRRE
jgi:uncharacterized protein YbcC (UPF0753/DUF2309 family)